MPWLKKNTRACLVFIGFLLSPISWWNDIFINFPLSYAFALPFGYINAEAFIPALIIGYFLSNILGLILMHLGITGSKLTKKQCIKSMTFSLLYAIIICILAFSGLVTFPREWLEIIDIPK